VVSALSDGPARRVRGITFDHPSRFIGRDKRVPPNGRNKRAPPIRVSEGPACQVRRSTA